MVFCNKCRCETDIEIDDAKGISCCVQCGCVLEDIAFSADVTFQKDAAGESTVVGQFVNESGVARGIGRIHGGRVYAYQADSHERAQQRGRQDIAHLVDQLSVRPREETIESSHRLYKLALQRGFTRGRRTNQVAAACLYLVCRQDSKPFLLIDFSDALQVNVFTLGAVFLQLAKLLRLEEHPLFSKPVDPSLYIHRFADRMDFPNREIMQTVSATAIRLVASMKRDWIQTGRRPSGVCGAALYIASHLHGYAKAKRDVVDVVHIGEHTLAKRLTEFSSTEAGALTRLEFEAHDELLKHREQEALESAVPSAAPAGLLAGCEHLAMGVEHFQQGMCKQCFVDFVKHTGGTYDGANPPAFLKNRQHESKKGATLSEATALLALPAPGDGDGSADKEQKEGDDEDKEAVSARGKKGSKGKAAAKGKAKKGLSKGSQKEPADAAPSRSSRRRGGADAAAAAAAAAAEDHEVEEDAGAGPSSAAGATAAMEKLTTAMIEAAEKEVESFDAAIAEAEAHDAHTAKRRKTMSTAAAVAAATAAAVREAAQDAGAEEEDAEAAAGAMVSSSAAGGAPGNITTRQPNLSLAVATTSTAPAATAEEEQPEEEDDGNLSEISDGDIAMYLADEAEVACKEEIWNLMNQDWVEKQAAKRAAMEAAERAQEEQRAAMEAAAAAGIQYKRGRGRPLGSKTRPKPETNLPPAETPQEAAMRMLDTKKLSSKINYTALADLFSDEPAGGGGQDSEDDEEEEEEDDDGAGPSNTHGYDGTGPSTSKAAAGAAVGAAAFAPTSTNQGQGESDVDDPSKLKSSSLIGGNGIGGELKRPASRIAGMAPRAAGRLGGLSSGTAGGGGGGRLGGLNESLTARPLGTPLGNTTLGGVSAGTGTGSALNAKKSNTKVRFKPGTKKD